MSKLYAGLALAALALGLVAAGCGGSGGSTGGEGGSTAGSTGGGSASGGAYSYAPPENSAASEPEAASESGGGSATVAVGKAAGAGEVLVDAKGMTLYYFVKDGKGSGESKCEGACAEAWPPLASAGEAQAMGGVEASLLGTIERPDGTTQVTYAGWPLYTFVEDTKPGEDNGTDSKAFGAPWYPLHPDGEKAGE